MEGDYFADNFGMKWKLNCQKFGTITVSWCFKSALLYWGKKQRTVSREDHNVGFFECGYHSESENDFESLLEMFELLVSLDQWNMEEYKVY